MEATVETLAGEAANYGPELRDAATVDLWQETLGGRKTILANRVSTILPLLFAMKAIKMTHICCATGIMQAAQPL